MWGKSGQIYPIFSVYKTDNFLLFLYFIFQILDFFHNLFILYISYGSKISTRQGRGKTMAFPPGQNNGVTQRVTK